MKQIIASTEHPISARITIPGSKSITNRALLLAALAEGSSEISDILISDDTLALIHALKELGVSVALNKNKRTCRIEGVNGQFPQTKASIWCAEAGTVARFLMAACANSEGHYFFDGSESLRKRPIAPLIAVLNQQGAKIQANQFPCEVIGIKGLKGGMVEIDGSQSSQFVSALLMVAPFAKSSVTIASADMVSRPFVKMTCEMMAEFGVLVKQLHHLRYFIPVPQRYKGCAYRVEPDLSTASYFFAAAAVTAGEVTIQPVAREQSKQGDISFLSVLEKMGCEVIESKKGLTVRGKSQLHGVNVDMRDYSDTFMTLAAIAPFATTPTTITNIGHTRLQETNRISCMREELVKLGAKVEEGKDWLKVYPSSLKGCLLDTHGDHRLAMSLAVIGLRVAGVEIAGAECVAKTCPEFFELLGEL